MVATCSGCPTRWTGLKISHCGSCHQTFSSVRHFDRHRRDGRCLDPESVGLTIGGRGYWSTGWPTPGATPLEF